MHRSRLNLAWSAGAVPVALALSVGIAHGLVLTAGSASQKQRADVGKQVAKLTSRLAKSTIKCEESGVNSGVECDLTNPGASTVAEPAKSKFIAAVATCLSKQSRNHHVGEELGKGRKLDDIIASMNMVAEGVKSCAGILAMAGRVSCDMPIASRVGKVLYEGADVKEMVDSLLTREAEPEFMGIQSDG